MKNMTGSLICAAAALLLLCGSCNAALTMTLDRTSVDFGTLTVSDWHELPASGNFNIFKVVSDTANVWWVTIRMSQSLTNSTFPTVTIPDANFKWMSTYAGHWTGTQWWDLSSGLNHLPALGYVGFTTVSELVYTAGTVAGKDDKKNDPDGTEVGFKYAISVPSDQTAGTYTTTIVYTVTQ